MAQNVGKLAARKHTPTRYISKNIDGADWQKKSARKPAKHYATALSTLVPGHPCTAFSNSVSLVFQGVKHTAAATAGRAGRESAG